MANAVKYSPNGGKVAIDCYKTASHIVFSVSYDGLGIAAHDLDSIFERYYRVQGRDSQNIAGFGIGLYLSAEIISMHGGKIWAESELGKGSTFYASIPLVS